MLTSSLDVPWPPAPGTAALSHALAPLRQVRAMTVYERVTSDAATGACIPHPIEVTGSQFLSVEPYASGVAPLADLAAVGAASTCCCSASRPRTSRSRSRSTRQGRLFGKPSPAPAT